MGFLSKMRESREVNESKETNVENNEKKKSQILDIPEKKSDYNDGLDAKLDAVKQEREPGSEKSKMASFKEQYKAEVDEGLAKENLEKKQVDYNDSQDDNDKGERERGDER